MTESYDMCVCVCLRDCYAVFPLQYSCLENPLDGGTWWAMVHQVTKSWTWLSNFTFTHWRRKWQPTPVFLPRESQGWGSLVGCRLWSRTESATTEATWQPQQHAVFQSSCVILHPTISAQVFRWPHTLTSGWHGHLFISVILMGTCNVVFLWFLIYTSLTTNGASQVALVEKNTSASRRCKRCRFNPWLGKSPGGRHGNPLQYSCLERIPWTEMPNGLQSMGTQRDTTEAT